ncbi:MAG: T9SS type A sorting domain-containing protein [Chitinophagaceae bacterium]|nr:T9SS type A sorting domain-containing protein [Chitinophagaceae bacterium]
MTNNATYTFAGGTIRFTHGDDPDECIAGAPGTSFTVSDMATVKNIYSLRTNGLENGPDNHFQFDNVADITLPDMTFRGRYFFNGWPQTTTGSLIPGNVELLSTSDMFENVALTLSKDINTDSLALDGSIILGDKNLTVKKTKIGNIWPFGQGQAANYPGRKVVTNGTGKMSFLPFTGQAIFPVAHTTNLGSNYMPIRINNTAGPAEGFSVRAADNVQFAYNPNLFKTNTSTWLIDETTPGGNTAVLSFQWDKSASEIGFVLNDAQAAHFDGNNVNLVTGTPNNPDNICETFVTAPVTQFSPWSIFSPFKPLPVSLINFNATLINKKVALNWSTATETNNDRFEIERSVDGINFNKIGQVKGKGNSILITDYNYDDDVKGINGSIFYRLKQIDLDEKFAYSPIKSVTITAEKILVNIGPNPFIDQIKINVNANKAGKMVIRLLNNNGQAVITSKYATKQGVNELKLNSLSNLPKGLYTLELTDVEGNNSKIYKLIK